MAQSFQCWGRQPHAQQEIAPLRGRDAAPVFEPGKTYLAHGLGRSYGDSCLNDGGVLLAARGMDRFISFDAQSGVLACEAGVSLAEIVEVALPRGWFLPVTPGTRFVTVGGAIANDVHGKNHHSAGAFGCHVPEFELLRSDGSVLRCSAGENAGLYAATIGGLGLTGLIRWARLQLRRVPGPWLIGESIKFGSLAEFFALSRDSDRDYEYTVSWVDCLNRSGRGIFMRGRHAPLERPPPRRLALRMPFTPPISLVNQWSLRAFNSLYWSRQQASSVAAQWHWDSFFYPLDGILDWNRMYGPRGFFQYQCLLPMAAAEAGLAEMLRRIADAGQGSFLAVLKIFGDQPSPGLLSFPRPGATLALDFPNRGEDTLRLLEDLDAITMAAGGAVYPAKDARMSAAAFRRYFPRLEEFRRWIDPRFSSSFWRRVQA